MTTALANILGIAALLAWSMSVGLTRHLAEAHRFGLPGLSFFTAGILMISFDFARGKKPPWRTGANPLFWLLAGGAFVGYIVFYDTALSWSASRDVVLTLGLVNYFWPALILLIMPVFFVCRVNWAILGAGLLLCLSGVGMALLRDVSIADVMRNMADDWPAFLIMTGAAFLWAFYSNAARKWAGRASGAGWFMLTSGLVLLVMWRLDGGPLGFEPGMTLPFLVHALVVNAAAYALWELGVRRGDLRFLGLAANFLPLASVIVGSWYLGGGFSSRLWLGGGMVALGAYLCGKGLGNDSPQAEQGT